MSLGTAVLGGGSGFIGKAIRRHLISAGYNVLTVSRQPGLYTISWNDLVLRGLPEDCTAVINVAGQNVLDWKKRWTPGFQQNVYASRIHSTRLLREQIAVMDKPPKVFGVISGVGYYKSSDTEHYTEDSPGGDHDYFSNLCSEWEDSSLLPEDVKVRRFIVRSGVVLGRTGGIVSQLYWPFYFCLGGRMGTGKQYMPWIHVEDLAGIFLHAIQSENVEGILNGVSPEIITNKEFAKTLARAMWRPAILPLPALPLKLAFGKERAAMMLEGQKVIPKRTLESGYEYFYPDLKSACQDCAHAIIIDSYRY